MASAIKYNSEMCVGESLQKGINFSELIEKK